MRTTGSSAAYFAGNEATVVAQRMDVLERWNNDGVDADAVLELCADAVANEDELRAVWSLLRQMCEVGLARTVATALVGARARRPAKRAASRTVPYATPRCSSTRPKSKCSGARTTWPRRCTSRPRKL